MISHPSRIHLTTLYTTAVAAVVLGATFILWDKPIARLLAKGLPWRAEVASAGTNVPSFADIAPTIVWRSGVVLVVVGVLLSLVSWGDTSEQILHPRLGKWAGGAVIIATGLWYGWLAYPHNAFPSNSRFHWVDYLTFDSGNFFYAAGRVPHMLFYDVPHVWQGINASIVAALCYIIARQLGLSPWVGAAVASIPAISGNVLLFANTAEDVMLNLALLLGVISASLSRRPVLLGTALALAILGRPSFIVFTACMVAAEGVRGLRVRRSLRDVDWRFASIAGATCLGLTAGAQILFTVLGSRYFFVNGRFVDTGVWDQQVPREIDGFTIFPFSGTYPLHFLWVIPFVLIVGSGIALWTAKAQRKAVEATIYLSALAVAAHLLIHEAKPTMYYNVRYLTYVFPFMLFLALTALLHPRLSTNNRLRFAVVALFVLGTVVFPAGPVDLKRGVESRPDHELLEVKDELRALVDDRPVFLDYGNRASRNYVAYVLRGNVNRIRLLEESTLHPGSIVISTVQDPWSAGEPVIKTESFLVFDTGTEAS